MKNLKAISTRFKKKIAFSENILVVASRPPDLDSICTTIALKLYLKNQNKNVKAYCFSELPKKLKSIDQISEIEEKYVKDVNFSLFDLIILIDGNHWHTFFTNSWEKVTTNFDLNKVYVFDHHLASKIEEDIPKNTIRKEESCTAKVVFDFAMDKKKVTKEIAELLYLALVSDTQFFKVLVFKDTFDFANSLIKYAIDYEELNNKVVRVSEKEMDFLVFLYENTEFEERLRTSFLVLTEEFEEKIKTKFGGNWRTERLDELYKETVLRKIEGIDIGLIFAQSFDKNNIRVLWRVDNEKNGKKINKVLKKAGFELDGHLGAGVGKMEGGEMKEVVNRVKSLIRE